MLITGAVRDDDPLPPGMMDLEIEPSTHRPIPYFAYWRDGKPDFRVVDSDKWFRALRSRLCWVCGKRMGSLVAFVGAVDTLVGRLSSDPAAHPDCARWSARNCPVLANPARMNRNADLPERSKTFSVAAPKKYGAVMVYLTSDYTFQHGDGAELVRLGDPKSIEWYLNAAPAPMEVVWKELEDYERDLRAGLDPSDRQTPNIIRTEIWIATDAITKYTQHEKAAS